MKIRLVEAELLHVERQTDMLKQIVAFRNFMNTPKKWQKFHEPMGSDMVRSHGKCSFGANSARANTHTGGYIFYLWLI